jgi:hypothetical protein
MNAYIYYLKFTFHNINLKQTIANSHPGKPSTCYLVYWQSEGGSNLTNWQSEGESLQPMLIIEIT